MSSLAKLDQKFVWHPFTQMRDWLRREPIVIVAGQGTVLRDVNGPTYMATSIPRLTRPSNGS